MSSAQPPAAACTIGLQVAPGDFEAPHAVLPLQLLLGPPIGEGTSGVVSPLLQIIDGGRYVVKEVRPKDGSSQVDDSVLHEVKLHRLVSAECSNIVKYVFAQVTGSSLCVVLEACDAELWSALIGDEEAWNELSGQDAARKQLTQGEQYAVTLDLTGALQHCHKLRVLHRDVNPWNVFLLRRCKGVAHDRSFPAIACRLGDFGMGCQLRSGCETLQGIESEGATPLDESALGSLYSAPELGNTYGFAADVFSLGMTLLAIWVAGECAGNEDAIITTVEEVKEHAKAITAGSTGALDASKILPQLEAADSRLRNLLLDMTCADPGSRPTVAQVCEQMHAPQQRAVEQIPAVGDSIVQQALPQDGAQKPQGSKLMRCFMRCLPQDKSGRVSPSESPPKNSPASVNISK